MWANSLIFVRHWVTRVRYQSQWPAYPIVEHSRVVSVSSYLDDECEQQSRRGCSMAYLRNRYLNFFRAL